MTEKFRVLFVGHTYLVKVNQAKLEALANTGEVEVGLLVPKTWRASEWRKTFILETPSPEIRVYPSRILFNGRGGAHLYSPFKIIKTLSDFIPDLIQIEQEVFSLPCFEIAFFAKYTGKKLVVFCWENTDRALSFWRRWIRSYVLRNVHLIIAGNAAAGNLLCQWGYCGQIMIMPQLGVDQKLFSPILREIKNTELVMGYIGRLVNGKGIDLILLAARLIKSKGYKFQIIICGTGPKEGSLHQLAEKMNLTDSVTWLGAVPHKKVPSIMANLDILILPSRSIPKWQEQFGHVLIEAMAMGLPVVGSSCGEIPNVIGRADLVFPEENAEALAAILERMIREPEWRKEVGEYGIHRVREHFTHERIAARLLEVWRRVLNQKGKEFT